MNIENLISEIKHQLTEPLQQWVDAQCEKIDSLEYSKKDLQLDLSKSQLKSKFQKDADRKLIEVNASVNNKLKDLDIKTSQLLTMFYSVGGRIEGQWYVTDVDGIKHLFGFETVLTDGNNIESSSINVIYNLSKVIVPELKLER